MERREGCCCPYVTVNAVKVFWRWQALLFGCREYVGRFLHGMIASENRSLWEKGVDKLDDDDGETHIDYETDYSKVSW